MNLNRHPITANWVLCAYGLLALLLWLPQLAKADVNVLANPQWDPATTNGTDGGRNWSYTSRAGQINDLYSVGHPASTDGRYGLLKVQTYGTTANDFQYAQSPWYAANPGNRWTASAWFRPENKDLHGDQVGLLKVEIADASFNVLTNLSVSVVNAASNDVYVLGSATITAPPNAAYVHMQAGLLSPNSANGSGHVLVDDASLSTPDQVLPNAGWDPSTVKGTDGNRWWASYTTTNSNDRAYYRNDDSSAGRNAVSSQTLGYLKVIVDGNTAGDFQRAASGWFLANPGDSWTASVFGGQVSLQPGQVGTVVLQYADSNSNVLVSVTNTFLPAGSGSSYKLGTITQTAPAGATFVQMLAGVYCTNAAGSVGNCLFDDASLTTTNQMLVNPGWDPTRLNDNYSGSRGWTYSGSGSDRASQLNDIYNIGRYAANNGSRGVCKIQTSGTVPNSLQTATSDWYPATTGFIWKSSAYARTENASMHGSQVAFVRLEFADAATNALLSVSNIILTSASPQNSYQLGAALQTAPAGTALVRMSVGMFAPNTSDGSGYVLFDDARLARIWGAPTSLGLSASANPIGYQSAVTFTGSVLTNGVVAGDATGSLVFSTNGVPFSTNAVSAGVAGSAAISSLPRGNNLIAAVYYGDVNYGASSNSLSQVVTNHPPVALPLTAIRTAGLNLLIAWADVQTNWSDADGDTATLAGLNLTTTNGVTLQTNNLWILYTNPLNLNDQISYTVTDGFGGTNKGIINVVINAIVTGTNSIVSLLTGTSNVVTAYGIPGYRYVLERSTNLTDWVEVNTNSAATNGVIQAGDLFPDLGGQAPASAYYRLKWQP